MSYNKTIWVDEIVENPKNYKIDGGDTVEIERDPGVISVEGTDINAAKMNNIEDGIEDAHDRIDSVEGDLNTTNTNVSNLSNTINNLPDMWEVIQTKRVNVGETASSINFTNIASKYSFLKLIISAACSTSTDEDILITLGDEFDQYSNTTINMNTFSKISSNRDQSFILRGAFGANDATYNFCTIDIGNSIIKFKPLKGELIRVKDANSEPQHRMYSGFWGGVYLGYLSKTDKVNISISNNKVFLEGTRITLMGLE